MLYDTPMTVEAKIRSLAEETGAPPVFVEQVRTLFENKNISLDEDCSPYVVALEEAFRREAAIRRDTLIAKNNLARLQQNFANVGAKYREQLARLQRARLSNPGRQDKRIETRKNYDNLRMVPGPKEVQ